MCIRLGRSIWHHTSEGDHQPDASRRLAANEVRIADGGGMPRARLTQSLNVGHGAQGVTVVQLFAPKLLRSAWIGGNEVHRLVGSDTLSECGVLSINLGFG